MNQVTDTLQSLIVALLLGFIFLAVIFGVNQLADFLKPWIHPVSTSLAMALALIIVWRNRK